MRRTGRTEGEQRLQFLQIIISGVAQGCIYGLIALGFVLIYKATETVSFAQGDLMMVGAFIGLACMTFLGFPPGWPCRRRSPRWRCSALPPSAS